LLAASCSGAGDCGLGGFCSLAQEDGDLDGEGDACEISLLPEPGPGGLLAGTLWLWVLHRARRRGAAPL
jgi:hypothetical protein